MTDMRVKENLIPKELLFGNPDRSGVKISPDGKWVSWLAASSDVLNVWLAPVADLTRAKVITADKKRGIRSHYWTPDSEYIIYPQDVGGNENFHFYIVEIDGGEIRKLSDVDHDVLCQMSAISKECPGLVLIATNDRDRNVMDLYQYNYIDGSRKLLVTNKDNFFGYVIDHQLIPRFAAKYDEDGNVVYYYLADDGSVGDEFMTFDKDDASTSGLISFNAAGDILYIVDSTGRDKTVLKAMTVADKSQTILAESDIADIGEVDFDPVTHNPQAYVVNRLKPEFYVLADEVKDDFELLKTNFRHTFVIGAKSDDNNNWIIFDNDAATAGIYYLYCRAEKKLTKLFERNSALAQHNLQPMHAVEITARDGLEMVSYLTMPAGIDINSEFKASKPVPMLLWVHGGPWARDQYAFNPVHQWIANRGYAILSVNYRGSTGFGKNHINLSIHEWAGKMHDDLIDAVNWAIDRGITEPGQIAIGGGSYGGYSTLVGLTFTPDVFACGIDIVGPSNLVTLLETIPPYWSAGIKMFTRFVGDVENADDRQRMFERSPLSRVDAIKAPLLIGQGQNDPRVKKAESDQIVSAMVERDLPVVYINYSDEGHGFARPANRISFYAIMEAFMAEHLGGKIEPFNNVFKDSGVQVLAGLDLVLSQKR